MFKVGYYHLVPAPYHAPGRKKGHPYFAYLPARPFLPRTPRIELSKVTYDEIYLFSQENDKVITDNKIKLNDNIYIIIEGLKGFNEANGMVFPGLTIKVTDSAKNAVLDSDDLFLEYSESGIAAIDLADRVSAHFSVQGTQSNNQLHCELTVWDKKSDAKIKVITDLVLD